MDIMLVRIFINTFVYMLVSIFVKMFVNMFQHWHIIANVGTRSTLHRKPELFFFFFFFFF